MPDEPDSPPQEQPEPKKPATLTADRATEIARAHGLNLSDAAAIHSLATSEAEAESIAARFAPAADPDAIVDAVVARRQGRA